MKKTNMTIMLFFAGLLLVSFVSASNWYVDNAVATSGNGQSWSNAWKNFVNINWASVQPGDTIYLSGGTTQKTYFESMTIRKTGITITRGLETGHTGIPIIRSPNKRQGSGFIIDGGVIDITPTNILISNLEFRDWFVGIEVDSRPSIGEVAIDNVTIKNNSFYNYFAAVSTDGRSDTQGNYLKNVWILNNYIEMPPDGSSSNQIDGMSIYYTKNLYVIGNTFINRNTKLNDSHNDFVQGQYINNQYYFNNFFMIKNTIEVGQNGVQSGGNSMGDLYFANNIINMGTWTIQSAIWAELSSVQNPDKLRIVNNHFIGGQPRHLFLGADPNAVIKNNLFWATGTHTFGDYGRNSFIYIEAEDGSAANLVVENNNFYWYMSDQLYLQGTGAPTMPVSNSWLRYPDYSPSMVNFNPLPQDYTVNTYSENPQDYRLTIESIREIDKGEVLQQSDFTVDSDVRIAPWYYISRDFNGNLRTGIWDIGAYEYVSGSAQYHPADTNHDGCISLGEISSYVGLWLSGTGQVTMSQASSAVSTWMGGC